MTPVALVILPLVGAACLLAGPLRARAAVLLAGVAGTSLGLAVWVGVAPYVSPRSPAELVRIDEVSRLFLGVINAVFTGVSIYAWSRQSAAPALRAGMPRFSALALAFLASANATLISNHMVVLWIALEGTTFAGAALIVRRGVRSSQVASFRYVLFSSVGLGLALLGLLCLARGGEEAGLAVPLSVDGLADLARDASTGWARLGIALTLLGLATKLGLAPMYSWLPEAYDEAPPSVAALLGGVQFNCALVMLLRVVHACRPSQPALVMGELVTMGIVSMGVSTVSIIATTNMKRLIAYASINHAGVIAIGLGLGKGASFGVLLYILSNAFIKAILFLTAGKIKAQYGTKDTRQISGLIKDLPYSGLFLMVGTFALLGFPPFGSFVGELLILSALVSAGQVLVFGVFCTLMAMTFVATGRTIFPMIWGEAKMARHWPGQTFSSASPKIVFLMCLVVLGVYIPPGINSLIHQVAASIEAP